VRPDELGEEIAIELEALETTVDELLMLQRDVAHRGATVRKKTAAAAFLAQFYDQYSSINEEETRFFRKKPGCWWPYLNRIGFTTH
jgi:hypothetical protein